MRNKLTKYPRTQHIEGSLLQPGDEDLAQVPFEQIQDRFVVVEEKIDGANTGISFSADGQLLLQSRGHYLRGGAREEQFNLLKQWAPCHAGNLYEVLGTRYIMYGEWMYAKHTVFYDLLPHYFLEFDIYDTENAVFLSTERRQQLLTDLPVVSVPIVRQGRLQKLEELTAYIGRSHYISAEPEITLRTASAEAGVDPDQAVTESALDGMMEGLYLKVEENGVVTERYKWVRTDFFTAVQDSESHWMDRPIIVNQLVAGTDIFSGDIK